MALSGNVLTDVGRGSSAASRAEVAGVLEEFEQTRVARNELSPPVGLGECGTGKIFSVRRGSVVGSPSSKRRTVGDIRVVVER